MLNLSKWGYSNLYQHCHPFSHSSSCQDIKMILLRNRKLSTQIGRKKRLYFLWKCKGANWLIGCAEWTSFWCLRRVWVDATGPPLVEHLELIFQGVMYLQWPDLPSFAWDKKHAFLTWLAGVRSPAGMDQVEWKDQRSNALNKLHENQFVIS